MILSGLEEQNLSNSLFSASSPALGIPGFWWGCLLGPVGIGLAYIISDNDKHEAKAALTGCIIAGAVEVVVYLVYFVYYFSYFEAGI